MGFLRRTLGSNWPWQDGLALRDEPQPLEGTRMDLFNSVIPNFFAENGLWSFSSGMYGTPDLAQRVWVANRCQKLNAQAIAAMRLEWHGPPGAGEPMWVSSPDPSLFPNGIGDALHAIVDQLYGYGYSLQYVTSTYADGYPRTWTVIPSGSCTPQWEDGRRVYKMPNDTFLDPGRVVQIDRNPSTAAHGTPALRAYAQVAYGLLAANNQSLNVNQGGIPQAVLESEHRLTKEQAEAARTQWQEQTAARNGGVPVLGQGWKFTPLSINPADLALLDTQQWNAMVIATAYGVPGPILNMALTGGLTYQNPIALMQMWWLTELSTTSKRIMDAFSAQMLPRGQWVTQDATDMTVDGSIEASDDPQLSPGASASPAQQPARLQAIGG